MVVAAQTARPIFPLEQMTDADGMNQSAFIVELLVRSRQEKKLLFDDMAQKAKIHRSTPPSAAWSKKVVVQSSWSLVE
jgi:hypothetical protein